MSRHEYEDNNDIVYQYPDSLSPDTAHFPRHPHRDSKQRRLRRHERTQSQPQPIHGLPSPVATGSGVAGLAPPPHHFSPPPRDGPSPTTEIALLPGGGVEIPAGFRFTQEDQGHYRYRGGAQDDGGPDQPRVLGGLGFGMLKGLKKLPAALARAGRGTRPRQDVDLTPEDRDNLPIDDDVETYLTQPEDEEEAEDRVREEDVLREYIQQRRMRRDRAYRHTERNHRERYVPAPQPVPVPGSRTPVPSAVGYSEAPPVSALEAEIIAEEHEALAQAQEIERVRNVYASEAVKPPSSVSYSPISRRTHHRTASAPPRPPPRVFSHWAAERDHMGRRVENRSDASISSTSPLSFPGFVRLLKQIRDMPWVSERVAADYIPGGLRPSSPEYTSTAGYPVSGVDTSNLSPVPMLPPPPGHSWYAPREDILVLPEGVAPPPGFIPFPYPHPYSPPAEGDLDGDRAPSASSHTHVEAPVPVHASGPTYVEGETYNYMPAEASATGQSYIVVPPQHAGDGRGDGSYASQEPRTARWLEWTGGGPEGYMDDDEDEG